nr:hypothetical protein [Morchella crassipes]
MHVLKKTCFFWIEKIQIKLGGNGWGGVGGGHKDDLPPLGRDSSYIYVYIYDKSYGMNFGGRGAPVITTCHRPSFSFEESKRRTGGAWTGSQHPSPPPFPPLPPPPLPSPPASQLRPPTVGGVDASNGPLALQGGRFCCAAASPSGSFAAGRGGQEGEGGRGRMWSRELAGGLEPAYLAFPPIQLHSFPYLPPPQSQNLLAPTGGANMQ